MYSKQQNGGRNRKHKNKVSRLSQVSGVEVAYVHTQCRPMQYSFVNCFFVVGGRNSRKHVLELESLASNLSETVNDKSIAVAHQKKANKFVLSLKKKKSILCVSAVVIIIIRRMLASRIADLEHRLKVLEVSGLWSTSPGQQPKLYSWDGKDHVIVAWFIVSSVRTHCVHVHYIHANAVQYVLLKFV